MNLNIKNAETYRLAAELADLMDETMTTAVTVALRECLTRRKCHLTGRQLADELDEIAIHCAALPVLDGRSDEELLGYDEHGLPS